MKIEIHSPCDEPLAAMRGAVERMHCERCQKHVHNLSMMAEAEAHALLRERGREGLCVRIDRAGDGTPRFRDLVPVAALRVVRAGLTASMLVAAGLGAHAALFTSYGGYQPQERRTRTEAYERVRDPEQAIVGGGPLDEPGAADAGVPGPAPAPAPPGLREP